MNDFKALKSARKARTSANSYLAQGKPSAEPPNERPDLAEKNGANTSKSPSEMPAALDAAAELDIAVDSSAPVAQLGADAEPSTSEKPLPDVSMDDKAEDSCSILSSGDLYKALPSTLQICMTKAAGRGIYSTAGYKPGDILFSVKPHVAALSNEHLDGYCSSCFGPGTGALQRCTRCKVVLYCDAACQSKDWSLHKKECPALQKWMASSPPGDSASSSHVPIPPNDAVRCLGRILWWKQKVGPASTWVKEVDALQSHRTSLSKDPNAHDSQIHAHLAHSVVRYLDLSSPQDLAEYGMHSAADLVDFISRFTTNTFTVTTPTLSPLGACVSPTVALINHSCDPNAVVVFPRAGGNAIKENEPLLQVIALKFIHPSEEVLTSYIDTTLPRHLRQKALKETYHFSCKCSLCSPLPSAPIDMREAMRCPKKCGGICLLPTEQDDLTRCSKCKAAVKDTDAVLDAVRIGQEALEKAERVQESDPPKALQLTGNLIPILTSAGLVPSAHPLLALSRLHTSLLITKLSSGAVGGIEEVFSPQTHQEFGGASPSSTPNPSQMEAQQALDDVIRSATRADSGLSQILTFGHPVRGVSLAELGKLLSVDEPAPKDVENADLTATAMPPPHSPAYPPSGPKRLKLARETLVRARSELNVGFGGGKNEGGEVGQAVRQQIVDIEKELSVWKSGIKNALQDLPSRPRKPL